MPNAELKETKQHKQAHTREKHATIVSAAIHNHSKKQGWDTQVASASVTRTWDFLVVTAE